MFSFKHPRPLLSTRAVAVQMVARKAQAEPEVRMIIVEKSAKPVAAPVVKTETAT